MEIFNKLEDILTREQEVVNAMAEQETLQDASKLQALMKEQLEEAVREAEEAGKKG